MLIIMAVQLADAEDIVIAGVYSDIDSADITLHADEYYTSITIDVDLIFEGKVLESRHVTIEEMTPNTDITKVFSWNIANPEDGFYRTRMTLSMDGSLLDTQYYNFSYGSMALPRLFIEDVIPDSSGVSVILAPSTSQFGTDPVLTDVEYMLVDGDTVIYRITDRRITVVQATPLSKNWNVRLENNHHYSTRVKVRISSPQNTVIAQSEDFIAIDDVRITELYRDETGASVTVLGMSQVPFIGSIIFTVSKDGNTIEKIQEKSPVLMSEDDETIEVTWSDRLPPGLYELSVEVVGNDGDVLNKWNTIIEAEQSKDGNDSATPTPTQTPGFSAAISLIVLFIYLFSGLAGHRNG
jgi:hypothetical protein